MGCLTNQSIYMNAPIVCKKPEGKLTAEIGPYGTLAPCKTSAARADASF
jgi:hypothetical protein